MGVRFSLLLLSFFGTDYAEFTDFFRNGDRNRRHLWFESERGHYV